MLQSRYLLLFVCFQERHKGISHLIDIENPNRAVKKQQKLSALDDAKGPQLSRKERYDIHTKIQASRYRL